MASSLIGSLRVALGLDTAQFESGAAKAKLRAKETASSIEQSFTSAKRAVEGLFAAFTVGFLTDQVKKSLDYAGSLAEVSRTLGVTTKDLQTFRYAASQTGVAQDQLEVGLRRLTVSIGKAELGSKAQAKAFNALGISVNDLKGKTTGDVFRLMADALSKVTDRSQRAAIEMTLMGRSGSTLDNLLAPGAARLNELADAAQRLGIVLSDEQIQGAEETAHKLEAVKEVLSAQIAGVVANNAQAILSLSSALATLTGSIIKFLGSNPQLALGIIGTLLGLRFGGLPGAIAGGIAGVAAGNALAQSAADSNTDLTFRTQQMRAAQQAYFESQQTHFDPNQGERPVPANAANVAAARNEFIRQIGLLKNATAQARANQLPKPTGVDLPQFLAGGGKGGGRTRTPKDKNEADEFQFDQQMREQDLQILDAKKALSHDIGQQAELALQALDVQNQIANAEIDHKVAQAQRDYAEGKITKATLDQITSEEAIAKGKQAQLTQLDRQKILDDRDEALLRESIDLDSHSYDIKAQQLQKQADLAKTAEERRAIELELLDLQYKEKRIMLDRIINESKNADDVAKAKADRAALDQNYQLDRANVIQQTRNPLEEWAAQVPQTAAMITEAFQKIETDGLDGIASAIGDIITGTRSLKDAFADVAKSIISEIVQMSVKMLLFRTLSSVFGGAFGGGASLGNLGNFSFPDASAINSVHFATGGSFTVLGNRGVDQNVMSINGLPIANVSHGERISVGNDNYASPVVVNQTINADFAGGAATQEDVARMGLVARTSAIQAIREERRRAPR